MPPTPTTTPSVRDNLRRLADHYVTKLTTEPEPREFVLSDDQAVTASVLLLPVLGGFALIGSTTPLAAAFGAHLSWGWWAVGAVLAGVLLVAGGLIGLVCVGSSRH